MDFFNSRYFRINKFFLSFLGLWPYQTPHIKSLVVSLTMLGPAIILFTQVMYFLKHSNDLDKIFEVLPFMCGAFINLMKAICLIYNSNKFKMLLRLTQEDWNNLPECQETQIITRYAAIGRKFTLVYSYSVFVFATCYAFMPLVAPILDIIMPLNETRPRKMLYSAEYLVSQEKYYHTILLSEYVGYIACALIAIATDTTYFLLLEHICGMQTILCYRLENLKAHEKLGWISNDKSREDNGIKHCVRCCIQLDKRIRGLV